jgi:hypothetical protein
MTPKYLLAGAALLLGGCAYNYQLTLMPRDSGKLYYGTAVETTGGEGQVSITLEDRTYTGPWVQVTSDRSYGYVSGGFGYGRYGRYGGYGLGLGTVSVDNPEGALYSALLQSADGAGLRCEFRGSYGRGGGHCRDDRGREYDVQLRAVQKAG